MLRCPTKKTPDENKGNANSAHYHTGVDAWAVGVFAYELITGAAPFKANEMIETARNIIHSQVGWARAVPRVLLRLGRGVAGGVVHWPGGASWIRLMLAGQRVVHA